MKSPGRNDGRGQGDQVDELRRFRRNRPESKALSTSEIAAGRRVRHPGDVLSIGQRVEASVRKIDHAARRIALSIKALAPVPK